MSTERIWRIDPVPFHHGLVGAAREACRAAAGSERELPSGALHDASELARIVPAAMIFSSSKDGLSHAPGEDTPEADLDGRPAGLRRPGGARDRRRRPGLTRSSLARRARFTPVALV